MNQPNRLNEISYYQTGGSCDLLISPHSVEELADAVIRIRRDQIPYYLLGAGSNSLVMDDHWPGAVILFDRLQRCQARGDWVTAEAGVDNTALAECCLTSSLTGAEWMNYLPGQLGATVRMNARCYGGEISRIVEAVTVVTQQGKIRRYENRDLFRGYKDTIFMTNGDIVAEAEIRLATGDPEEIRSRMDACREDRESKHQFTYPSCGCVFKNDYTAGVPSGLLLDRAGVRELSTDSVEVSPWHANFVFNRGATAREILEITLQMREATFERFGVWLEFEMEILGLLPKDLKSRLNETRPPQLQERELAPLRELFNRGMPVAGNSA